METLILNIAEEMADNMATSTIPIYGDFLRLPDRREIIALLKEIRCLMFPAYFGDTSMMSLNAKDYSALYLQRIERTLKKQFSLALSSDQVGRADELANQVLSSLPSIHRLLLKDMDALFEGDPAAKGKEEVIFSYPGLFAIFCYRIAHEIYKLDIPMIPRMMTEYAHSRTGIDIHPGAEIGDYFFIDHGTGIVVGETTVIGDHVKLYQGVTLGALSPRHGRESAKSHKRHPTVKNGATIYSGASIFGGETIIGENAVVGGNAFLTTSVEDGAKVSIQPVVNVRK